MAESKKGQTKLTEEDVEKINAQFRREAQNLKSDEKIAADSPSIFAKAKSYAEAMVSKGLTKKECSGHTKVLRILSCHGDNTESLPPCSERMNSEKFADSFYCGKCGCGDKKGTQLVNMTIKGEPQYSKLDYPKVSCPLKMPGFTDYVPSEEGISDNYRKKEIEKRHGVEYIRQHSNP